MNRGTLARVGLLGAAALAMVCGLGPSACDQKKAEFVPPPPPEVTVTSPRVREIEDTLEYTGVIRGLEEVDVRARVRGFLERKHVADGSRVKKGELLFTIDPRTFEATLSQARAEVAVRSAERDLAKVTLDRMEQAAEANAASPQELDQRRAEFSAAEAQVDLAKAAVRAAELDLEFTEVRSPIDGRIGIVDIDNGTLVGATEATLLARVVNDSKVYAEFDLDERTLLDLRRQHEYHRPGEGGRPLVPVRIALEGDTAFPHEGVYTASDAEIDSGTGTIRVKAVFENSNGALIPGAFARVQPVLGTVQALLIPDVGVQADQGGKYVLIVNDKGEVERRNVTVGPVFDRMRRVLDGLGKDERVIVNGVQRARPGIKVKAVEASDPTGDADPGAKAGKAGTDAEASK